MGWMFYFLVVVTFNIFCDVYANERTCKHPTPLENFSMEKFSGNWFLSAVDIVNISETNRFRNLNCGVQHFHLDKPATENNKWELSVKIGKRPLVLNGTYSMPDQNKGLLRVNYLVRNFFFDLAIMCTDYTNWAAAYVCYQLEPSKVSEFVVFYLRDHTKYDEMINTEGLDKCFSDVITRPAKELRKGPFDNCPAIKH